MQGRCVGSHAAASTKSSSANAKPLETSMNHNPYEPGNATGAEPRTRATRWMVWAGACSLSLAVFCLVATVVGMMWSFNEIATSTTTPKPSDLATGISYAMIPSIAAAPLALFGVAFLILGFVRRQPLAHE